MSVPVIQLGQCGNQVGSSFYSIMFNQGTKASPAHQALLSQFFSQTNSKNSKNKAKAILIDMEPKVVNKNLQMQASWAYDKSLSFIREEGSGNNWAYGYNIHGPKIKQGLSEMFQTYAQRQDYIKCFLQFQSMAGGTGSGLGTYIFQFLGQQFPKTPKFATCIMPHLSGQVILQSYNAILSLGTILKQSEGIFILQNDQVSKIQTQYKAYLQSDINEVIGRDLASVFFPTIHQQTELIYSVEQNGFNYAIDLIENLFYDNNYKISCIKSAPYGPKNSQSFNSDSWQAVINDLLYSNKNFKHRSSMLIARGPSHAANFPYNSIPTWMDKHIFYQYDRSATLLQTGGSFIDSLEQILSRAYQMYHEKAYLYQYKKFGIQNEQFSSCFCQIEDILMRYSKL